MYYQFFQLTRTRKLAQTIKEEQENADDDDVKPIAYVRGAQKVSMLLQTIKDEPNDEIEMIDEFVIWIL